MNKTSDVIVIGAGVVGCSAAYYLSKAGMKVTVLERREIAFGASGRNGTGARQSGRDNRELPLAMFGVKNIWPYLAEELGEDIEYVQNGNMRMGKTERDYEALQEIVTANRSLGLDIRFVTDVKEIRELLPMVADDVTCATWCPTDGHANPMRTTLALYKKARAQGAKFITNIKVLKLEKHAGRVRRVYTDDGVFEADRVILCAGYGSRKIMRTVGIDVPMLPQLTEAFITEPIPFVTEKYICAADGCFYAQQQCNGTWLIGGDSNYEIYDANYPREVTFSFSAPRIARFFLDYMPYAISGGRKGYQIVERSVGYVLGWLPCHIPCRGSSRTVYRLCFYRPWLRYRPGCRIRSGTNGHGRGAGRRPVRTPV